MSSSVPLSPALPFLRANKSPPSQASQGGWWRADLMAPRLGMLRQRMAILAALRNWFIQQDFLEVETPALQISPGLEVHLKAFSTRLEGPRADRAELRYLHTSPEFSMKKLLAGGLEKIFQLAKVFRNGEYSPLHHPEFTLLEWYRAHSPYRQVMQDCEALIKLAFQVTHRGEAHWSGALGYEYAADMAAAWEYLSVADAFTRYTGIDLLATTPDPYAPSLPLLAAQSAAIGVLPHAGDSWEDLVLRILLERIEPHLGQKHVTVLYDYPLAMAALARAKPEDGRLAERFEVYLAGVELANGFGELVDAQEQRRRFEADMAIKQKLYGESYPIDEDFLTAMAMGMPPASGVALGLDRLVMLACGAFDIRQIMWAPVHPVLGCEGF
jgi:elongation factor P--(R)-beta-lysine ligase